MNDSFGKILFCVMLVMCGVLVGFIAGEQVAMRVMIPDKIKIQLTLPMEDTEE